MLFKEDSLIVARIPGMNSIVEFLSTSGCDIPGTLSKGTRLSVLSNRKHYLSLPKVLVNKYIKICICLKAVVTFFSCFNSSMSFKPGSCNFVARSSKNYCEVDSVSSHWLTYLLQSHLPDSVHCFSHFDLQDIVSMSFVSQNLYRYAV